MVEADNGHFNSLCFIFIFSAGIGRTGCFIATAIGCHQLKEEGVVDALSIVCQLRLDR